MESTKLIFLFTGLRLEKKWYFLRFCHLLNVGVNNAWLFAGADDYADDMLAFTRSIEECWLTKFEIPAKNIGRQRLSATFLNRATQFDQIDHYI